MRRRLTAALAGVLVAALAAPASAELLITVDKTSQQMTVERDGQLLHTWPVSTGLRGHDTPSGSYKPFRMEATHFSREWDNAPMPHSIFFSMTGHAIHGSNHVRHLGRAASHGCVRLAPRNAATLFALVKQTKMANTRVVVDGLVPGGGRDEVAAQSGRRGRAYDEAADGGLWSVRRQRGGYEAPAEPRQVSRASRDPFAPEYDSGRRGLFNWEE